jgi:hypothetical protein
MHYQGYEKMVGNNIRREFRKVVKALLDAGFVIPAKSRKTGREPGSRKNLIISKCHWIPDLVRPRRTRPE